MLEHPKNLDAWLQLLLLPACTRYLYVPKFSMEERSGNIKKLQIAAINEALVQWRELNGYVIMVQKLLASSKQTNIRIQSNMKKQKNTNVDTCSRKLSYDYHTVSIRILSSNGITPSTPDTLYELQQKHPHAPPPYIHVEDTTALTITTNTRYFIYQTVLLQYLIYHLNCHTHLSYFPPHVF